MSVKLCQSVDIPEGQSRGITTAGPDQHSIILVRRDDQLYAYKNSCPHTGVELNWQPDQFLDSEGFYIQCAVHGAKFEVETGKCIWGPCANQSMIALAIEERDGQVWLLD